MKEGIFESLFVDILLDNNELITCGTIYRAPKLDKKINIWIFRFNEQFIKYYSKI